MGKFGERISLAFLSLGGIDDDEGKLTDECVCGVGHCRSSERGPEEVGVCALGKIQSIFSVLSAVIKLVHSLLIVMVKGFGGNRTEHQGHSSGLGRSLRYHIEP